MASVKDTAVVLLVQKLYQLRGEFFRFLYPGHVAAFLELTLPLFDDPITEGVMRPDLVGLPASSSRTSWG
jgi:hypothetical protein